MKVYEVVKKSYELDKEDIKKIRIYMILNDLNYAGMADKLFISEAYFKTILSHKTIPQTVIKSLVDLLDLKENEVERVVKS